MAIVSKEKWLYLKAIRTDEVDPSDAPALYKEFVEFLEERQGLPAHYVRYCQTFLAMLPYLDDAPGRRVLETGGFCDIARFLETKGFKCQRTKSDLRYSIDAEDNSVDILLSLEVIEHLKDKTETQFDEVVLFRGTGVSCYASEIERVLAPGGLVILTTPNPCSARALELLVEQKAPMVFRAHEREYTADELAEIFCKLEILHRTTHHSFFHLSRNLQKKWEDVFRNNNWDASGRGDDHFMVLRKPR
ncbi:MAG TPA: hypothetical protein VGK90_11835 [Rhizomicrobium sp.]|jgi:SAM-dependent methyltransferase